MGISIYDLNGVKRHEITTFHQAKRIIYREGMLCVLLAHGSAALRVPHSKGCVIYRYEFPFDGSFYEESVCEDTESFLNSGEVPPCSASAMPVSDLHGNYQGYIDIASFRELTHQELPRSIVSVVDSTNNHISLFFTYTDGSFNKSRKKLF